jgi:hypothetical protein
VAGREYKTKMDTDTDFKDDNVIADDAAASSYAEDDR